MNKLQKIVLIICAMLMMVQTGTAYVIPVELQGQGITDEYGLVTAAMTVHDGEHDSPEIIRILSEASIHLTDSGRTNGDYAQLRQWIEKTRKQRGG